MLTSAVRLDSWSPPGPAPLLLSLLMLLGCDNGGAGAHDLAQGCLDTPCVLPDVAASALDLCREATGGATDARVAWTDKRYRSDEGTLEIWLECTSPSAGLMDDDCVALCDAAGLDFVDRPVGECACTLDVPAEAALADEMIAMICRGAAADVALGTWTPSPGEDVFATGAQVTCRDGRPSRGQAACEELKTLVNDAIGADFIQATDSQNGCSITDY